MYQASEQLRKANTAGFETLVSLATTGFAGAERLAALNLNAARNFMEYSCDSTRALLAAKDVQGLATLAKPDTAKAEAYSRSVYEIASQTQLALSEVVAKKISELNDSLGQALDNVVKTAPAGSDLAVNAIRSALSAANTAYASMADAARQATGVAESGLAAASRVTPIKRGKKAL